MLKPFWEETYRNLGADTFGEPNAEITQLSHTLARGGSVWYSSWRIESWKSYVIEDEHLSNVKHRRPINKMAAWKI